jgi:regulator of protease activity HflC (stomatin/prohibitin superfamily)
MEYNQRNSTNIVLGGNVMDFATALRGFVALIWLVVVVLIGLAVVRASRGQKVKALSTTILVAAIAAVVLTTISAGLVFIRPEDRGVVISALAPRGYREQALQPGLRWIIPYFESVERYPISRQTYTMSIAPIEGQVQGDDSVAARTADGQEIFVDASVIYAIDPIQVVQLHIDWQDRYTLELVRPLARGVIRDAVSQFGVEEVYSTKRFELVDQIKASMQEKLQPNGITLAEFVLRNITFSPEYAASVEQKQIAEQLAQQAAFVVEQRRQEAEQARQVAEGAADAAAIRAEGQARARVLEAEAERQALELIAQALAENPDLLTYQYITKLAPGVQVMLVPNNAPYLLPLPTLEGTGTTIPSPVPSPEPEPTPLPTPLPTPETSP